MSFHGSVFFSAERLWPQKCCGHRNAGMLLFPLFKCIPVVVTHNITGLGTHVITTGILQNLEIVSCLFVFFFDTARHIPGGSNRKDLNNNSFLISSYANTAFDIEARLPPTSACPSCQGVAIARVDLFINAIHVGELMVT